MYNMKKFSFLMCLTFFLSLIVICLLLTLAGCQEWAVQPASTGTADPLIEPTLVDALVDTVTALTIANTASAPVNPYATPINIGLAGIVAMLEALRRKEKAARKFAERNNHVQNKT